MGEPRVGERHPEEVITQRLKWQGLVPTLSKDLGMPLYPGGTTKRKEHLSVSQNPRSVGTRKGSVSGSQRNRKRRLLCGPCPPTPGGGWGRRDACWLAQTYCSSATRPSGLPSSSKLPLPTLQITCCWWKLLALCSNRSSLVSTVFPNFCRTWEYKLERSMRWSQVPLICWPPMTLASQSLGCN